MAVQSAAIPYRYGEDGQVQILLITSRKKGRWVLPKGDVRQGMVPHSSAAKEAFEEAGVIGRTDPAPIASYQRKTRDSDRRDAIRVDVYPMAVTKEAPVWPEMHERKRRWATVPDALAIVVNKGIRKALKAFEASY